MRPTPFSSNGRRVTALTSPLPLEDEDCTRPLTLADALNYVNMVRDHLPGDSEMFDDFLKILRDWRQNNIDRIGVVVRVKELFKDYPELIRGFSRFLSSGNASSSSDVASENLVVSTGFLVKVKEQFEHDAQIYQTFLNILRNHRQGAMAKQDVLHEVSKLFERHPRLWEDFKTFLPD